MNNRQPPVPLLCTRGEVAPGPQTGRAYITARASPDVLLYRAFYFALFIYLNIHMSQLTGNCCQKCIASHILCLCEENIVLSLNPRYRGEGVIFNFGKIDFIHGFPWLDYGTNVRACNSCSAA